MIFNEMTEIHCDMTAETAIATTTPADAMAIPLPNNRSGVETGS
jgi:hypothetical protein